MTICEIFHDFFFAKRRARMHAWLSTRHSGLFRAIAGSRVDRHRGWSLSRKVGGENVTVIDNQLMQMVNEGQGTMNLARLTLIAGKIFQVEGGD